MAWSPLAALRCDLKWPNSEPCLRERQFALPQESACIAMYSFVHLARPSVRGVQLMNLADLKARVCRLDELSRGFAKEVTLWKACNDPLLYLERKVYLNAIQDALAGVEAARVLLVKVSQRLEKREK